MTREQVPPAPHFHHGRQRERVAPEAPRRRDHLTTRSRQLPPLAYQVHIAGSMLWGSAPRDRVSPPPPRTLNAQWASALMRAALARCARMRHGADGPGSGGRATCVGGQRGRRMGREARAVNPSLVPERRRAKVAALGKQQQQQGVGKQGVGKAGKKPPGSC
eukprot:gene12245-biopygen12871